MKLYTEVPNFKEFIEGFVDSYKKTIEISEKMSSKDKEENTKTIELIMEAIKSENVSYEIKSQLIKGPLDNLIKNQTKMSRGDKKYLKKMLLGVFGITLISGVLYAGEKIIKMKKISKLDIEEDEIIDVEFEEIEKLAFTEDED